MKINLLNIPIVFLLLLVVSCKSNAQQNEIDNYINSLMKEQIISGAAVAINKNGTWVFTKNYGYADVDGKQEISANTAFGIMSITKNFIACAVVQLADKKKIDLDAPVTKYLDKLPPAYSSVLVKQLLNHSAGVPDYVEAAGYMQQANRSQTPMEILQPVLRKPLQFIPGEKVAYSNSGYFLLGMLIEKVSATSLKDYLATNIFKPLEMNSTYLDDISNINTARAKGYGSVNGKLQEVKLLNPTQYWAAGGIVSTIGDMMKWNDALRTGKLLPVTEITQMMQPAKLKDGSMSEYGLGFELMNAPDMKVAGATGAGLGFNTANMQFLNDQVTVIVLTNTSNGNSTMIAKKLHDMIAGADKSKAAAAPVKAGKDKLDSLVLKVFTEAVQGNAAKEYFGDDDVFNKFKSETIGFIQEQGNIKDVINKGEKINPESIVRRYQISFEKGNTSWVIIFSKDGKIMVTNHM